MTGTVVKRKRFEGLIQFQEPLRQALVCIQAAFPSRFATSAQSEILKARNTPDCSYFLLTSDGDDLGEMPNGCEDRHLMMAIEQLEDDQTIWKNQLPEKDIKISAWLNSADPLASQHMYSLLAAVSAETNSFDLGTISALGTLKSSFEDSTKKTWMSRERVQLFREFESDTGKIFKADKAEVTTDGCTVSLLIEGPTNLTSEKAFEAALKRLKKSSRHLVMINYIGGAKPRLQCVYLTPMRLPLKDLQSSALKGFVLLRDIKETAKLAKSVLAS